MASLTVEGVSLACYVSLRTDSRGGGSDGSAAKRAEQREGATCMMPVGARQPIATSA